MLGCINFPAPSTHQRLKQNGVALVNLPRLQLLTGIGDFNPLAFAVAGTMVTLTFVLSVMFFLRAETYLADQI